MKNDLGDIGKYLKKVNYAGPLRPTRDWLILLSLIAFLILISIGWNLWMFTKVTSGASLGNQEGLPKTEPLRVDRVQALFEKRAAEEMHYLNGYRFVDPSRLGGSVTTPP